MPKVVFTPSGRRGEFPEGTSLLDAARALGVDLDSVCGGRGICGRCQVTVGTGRFDKHGLTSDPDNAGPWTERETRFDAKKGLIKGRRLGCSAVVQGDMVVDVPPESQVHRPLVRKRADARPVAVDPIIHLHYVEVPEADLGTADGEAARIGARLVARGLDAAPDWDLAALRALQGALSKGKRAVTVAVHDRRGVIAVWPGFHERALGLAVDVGSTTIAAHLCDLADGAVLASAGAMNPQIRFGEDLMSRVSYAMMHPEGAGEMTAAVRAALNALAGDLCRDGGVDRTDILDMALVGNPVMHHLLLGLDPAPLGAAPFALAVDTALDIRATDLDLDLNPGARAYVLPCIAGHVGADAAAVALSEAPHRSDEPVLLIDVGTNAEIILGNRERLFAASSPTGPAFEGAQISAGQRAAPGAIERVRIDRETLEPRIRVIGCEAWSHEPGFAEGVAKTGVTGICGSGIIEAVAEMVMAGLLTPDGVVDGTLAARTPRIEAEDRTFAYRLWGGDDPSLPVIRVTQADVRAIQLAKAALHAGWRLLLEQAGLETVARTVLAGAFGAHIDPLHAMVLGMVPDAPLDRVVGAGNAAGSGARLALVNRALRNEVEGVVRRIEKIETATEPRFQEHFVDAMAFPHKTDPYPLLRAVANLPPPAAPSVGPTRRRNRRR